MKGCFVTATDTEAGKTLVSAGLSCLLHALVLKPVQTGCLQETDSEGKAMLRAPDVEAVERLGGMARALHCYLPPCSPHLACELARERLSVAGLARELRTAAQDESCVLVEGAGGLYVPLNEQESLLDLMQELKLPVILVVANRLGCLNQALLSIEAVQARGLEVAGLVLNRVVEPEHCDPGCGSSASSEDEARILNDNVTSLARMAGRRHVPLLADIPWLGSDVLACREKLLERLAPAARRVQELLAEPGQEAGSRESLLDFDRNHLWHPYTSATNPLPVYEVASTRANRLCLADGRELVDGMSSWWCAVHGYGNDRLIAAMTRQVQRMSHVMFGGITHRPAVELGRRLLDIVPRGLDWLFYADSGSVSVEVALKMAVQYQQSLGRAKRQHFLTPMGGYHGDTQGAMSVCDPVNGMHVLFSGLLPRHYFVERPACRFDEPFDPQSLEEARTFLQSRADEIAAVILEPVVQGAGGMWFYHPDYLKGLRELCDAYDILLICDEIATGFGRTGRLFACEWAGITPDIMCLGKALCGGMMTGAVTLATRRVAQSIGQAPAGLGGGLLMHGPTFMANPLFCATALASVDELLASPWQERVRNLQTWLQEGLAPNDGQPGVRDVRVLGAIGVVETEKPVNMATLQRFFVEQGVWIRPFDHLIYVMPPFTSPKEDVQQLCRAITRAVDAGLIL